MMTKIVSNPAPEKYNLLVDHPIQSWQWGEFRRQMGAKVERFIIKNRNQAGEVFFYRVPGLNFSIGHCPKINFVNQELIDYLKILGKKHRAIFIKIEPEQKKTDQIQNRFLSLGLKGGREIFSAYTMIINLKQDQEILWQNLKSKTRYNVRLAQKKGVKIIEDNSSDAFNKYWQLTQETTARQGFYAHNKKYHQKMWQIMSRDKIAHLFRAEFNQETVATWILFTFKNHLYYPYGASSRRHREVMASNLLMWEAILFGQKQGCDYFDLWGTPGPNPNKNDPWYGFHHFKDGYGPQLISLAGAYDLVLHPLLYPAYQLTDTLRHHWLRLKVRLGLLATGLAE
jgi:lipid II:glycine glycyltransferase (peptidoglycan interpeptide bridge formation enzyme)